MSFDSQQLFGVVSWLAQATWQSTLLVGVILALRATVGQKLNPTASYLLWLPLFIRLAMPLLPQLDLSIYNFVGLLPSAGGILEGFMQQEFAYGPLLYLLFGIWVSGVLYFGWRLTERHKRFLWAMNRSSVVRDGRVMRIFASCKEAMKVDRPVTIVASKLLSAPAVSGVWRPTLILPEESYRNYTDQELRFIFLHELAHLKNSDVLVFWVARIVGIVHWFNPLVWYAVDRMTVDCEKACDERVLRCLNAAGEQSDYGFTLLKLSSNVGDHGVRAPAALYVFGRRNTIKLRIQSITRFDGGSRRWGFLNIALIFGMTVLALAQPKPISVASVDGDTFYGYPSCSDIPLLEACVDDSKECANRS